VTFHLDRRLAPPKNLESKSLFGFGIDGHEQPNELEVDVEVEKKPSNYRVWLM